MKIIQKLRTFLISKLDKHNEELFNVCKSYKEDLKQCDKCLSTQDKYLRDMFHEVNTILRDELISEPYPKNANDIPEPQFPLFWKIHHKSWAATKNKLEELAQLNLKERNALHIKFNNDVDRIKDEYSTLERASTVSLLLLWLSERWNGK